MYPDDELRAQVHKRLHSSNMKQPAIFLLAVVLITAAALAGCDVESNPLAPYEGHRPLIMQQVTQSFTPDVQWVGGRVAAVGVNRGEVAALDSSLVWLMTSDDDDIGSHVTVGDEADAQKVLQFGGVPRDSLADGETYTVWLATKEALDAELNASSRNPYTFADTTITTRLILTGRQRGGAPVTMQISRDQRLTGTQFVVSWTPADYAFRRVAIRKGAALPAFTGLVWHVVLPDEASDSITSPVVIGMTPEGAEDVQAWPEGGFEADNYTLWMVDSSWNGAFTLSTPGLAYYQIFANNFEN